jgi:hypothetical protein
MVIKKPCTVTANAGDFNDHPLNTDCGSELHGTCFLRWHTEELAVSTRTFLHQKADTILSYYTSGTPIVGITNDFGTTTAFLRDRPTTSGKLHTPAKSSLLARE